MKERITNWIKRHKRLSKIVGISTLALVLCLSMMPVFAADTLTYLDVTGTYDMTSMAVPKYTDAARHPTVRFGELTITTQTGKAIAVATLEHMGADIALTGLVGPGSRPTIVLSGTDSDGTVVSIQAGVRTDREGNVQSLNGRIMGYVTSDGERFEDSADGTSAISVETQHSGAISTLLTAGTLANPETIKFNAPVNRMKLRNLTNLRAGQLGFYFNLENAKGPGPQMMLRFEPAGQVTRTYYGGGTSGLVDITIAAYQAPYTGDGTWKQAQITKDSGVVIYYGNDPTDYTSFGGTPVATLAEVEAAINAETAMTAGGDSASNWVLTMVSVELWEGGARTCYVDDVVIGGVTYTMEPNNYFSSFKAVIQ